MPSFNLERQHKVPVIGIDEAGRGPWAGPVVIAGVKFHRYDELPSWVSDLNDSKKLSALKREQLFSEIYNASPKFLSYSIQEVDVVTIDKINILEATMLGMRRCIEVLTKETEQSYVLVDGNKTPLQVNWCESVVKGDGVSTSIAAASVLAKVHRDRFMHTLASEYPGYGWESNTGYGTAKHQEALKRLGITPHHRKSFAPIKAMCV